MHVLFVPWSYVIDSREHFKGVDVKAAAWCVASWAGSPLQMPGGRKDRWCETGCLCSPSCKLNPWPVASSSSAQIKSNLRLLRKTVCPCTLDFRASNLDAISKLIPV